MHVQRFFHFHRKNKYSPYQRNLCLNRVRFFMIGRLFASFKTHL
ncbi:oxidoreductase [Listeria monocytogenes]|nr:oxidoreductase [Listeria monocytogenes]